MSRREVFVRVAGIHIVVIGLLFVPGLLKGCTFFEKKEQVMTVDLGALPPPPPPDPEPEQEDSTEPDENSVPEATSVPTPAPTRRPTATPTPAPEATPNPTATPQPTATPRPTSTPTPSYRALTPAEIRERIRDQLDQQPVQAAPTLSPERIQEMIAAGLPTGSGGTAAGGSSGSVSFDGVAGDLYARLYSAWQQPTSVSASSGLTVDVSVTVLKSGKISSSRVTRPSGHTGMDASVRRALSNVRSVKPLPDAYTGNDRTFTLKFEITR